MQFGMPTLIENKTLEENLKLCRRKITLRSAPARSTSKRAWRLPKAVTPAVYWRLKPSQR